MKISLNLVILAVSLTGAIAAPRRLLAREFDNDLEVRTSYDSDDHEYAMSSGSPECHQPHAYHALAKRSDNDSDEPNISVVPPHAPLRDSIRIPDQLHPQEKLEEDPPLVKATNERNKHKALSDNFIQLGEDEMAHSHQADPKSAEEASRVADSYRFLSVGHQHLADSHRADEDIHSLEKKTLPPYGTVGLTATEHAQMKSKTYAREAELWKARERQRAMEDTSVVEATKNAIRIGRIKVANKLRSASVSSGSSGSSGSSSRSHRSFKSLFG